MKPWISRSNLSLLVVFVLLLAPVSHASAQEPTANLIALLDSYSILS